MHDKNLCYRRLIKLFIQRWLMIVHVSVYDLQHVLECSTWGTELNGMHGRLLKVNINFSFKFDVQLSILVSISLWCFYDMKRWNKHPIRFWHRYVENQSKSVCVVLTRLQSEVSMLVLHRFFFVFFVCFVRDIIFFLIAGKSKEEAMSDYITKVKQLLEAAGVAVWQHCHALLFKSMLKVS